MVRGLDIFSLLAMGAGIGLMLQPWWAGGFEVGFFVMLAATVMQIAASHAPQRS